MVITDGDILGKKFESEKLQLDLTKDFYAGEKKKEEEIKSLLPVAKILHLTGKKTLALFKKWGWVDSNQVLFVESIPHTEICFMVD